MVKVGGGWNNINHYYERHVPVQRFEYKRSPEEKGQTFLSFKSHYKYSPKTRQSLKHKRSTRRKSQKETIVTNENDVSNCKA